MLRILVAALAAMFLTGTVAIGKDVVMTSAQMVVVVPKVLKTKLFTLKTATNITLRLASREYTGNYAEVRSSAPFQCGEYLASHTKEREYRGYGKVPTPIGWYSCQVSLMGGDSCRVNAFSCWEVTLTPTKKRQQQFVIESYWVEED